MYLKFPQSSPPLRLFAVILTCLFWVVVAMAQERSSSIAPTSQPQTIGTPGIPAGEITGSPAVDPAARKSTEMTATASTPSVTKSNGSADSAAKDYKKTLNDLATLYEGEVKKLEQQNNQVKGLYAEGLISRVEMETSDKQLADARAKVEEAQHQIATANQPAPIVPGASVNLVDSDVAWTTGNNKVDILVRYYGNKYGVDPYLVYCLMSQESRFTANATSPKGAQGLMQLMPGTAARYGVTNPYDVAQSIMGGTRYLKDLLQMFNGRIDLALAGYNAGENAVVKHGYTVPPYTETRDYVRLIIARYGKKQTSSKAAPALSANIY